MKKWVGVCLVTAALSILGCAPERAWVQWTYSPEMDYIDSKTGKGGYIEPFWHWNTVYPNYKACIQGIKEEEKRSKEFSSARNKGDIKLEFEFYDGILCVYDTTNNRLQLRIQCFPEGMSPAQLDEMVKIRIK